MIEGFPAYTFQGAAPGLEKHGYFLSETVPHLPMNCVCYCGSTILK